MNEIRSNVNNSTKSCGFEAWKCGFGSVQSGLNVPSEVDVKVFVFDLLNALASFTIEFEFAG